MKRRDFIKQMMLGAAGAVLLPLAGPLAAAEAAWQTGGAAGVRVKETYLSCLPPRRQPGRQAARRAFA